MIGQMAIVIALLGFNDLGWMFGDPLGYFSFQKQILFTVLPTLSKNEQNKKKKEVKKISRFLSSGNGIVPSCGCKALETMVAKCELVL